MNKLIVILTVCALLLGGCATFQTVNNVICNPTDDQKQTAGLMLVAIDAAQAVAAEFFPVAGIVKASAVLKTIQAGGCFLVDELAQAFAVVDAANMAVQAIETKKLKVASTVLPEYAPLRVYIK